MTPRKVWAVARKELRQASRDPLTLIMLLGVPTMMLLLYGYAINFDVRHVPLAVQDLDKSARSRNLVASFVNSTYFDQVADLPAGADLERFTERRLALAILVVPEGYARDVAAGRTAGLQLLLDGADANTATTVIGYAEALVASENSALARETVPGRVRLSGIDYQPRVWYNPELESTQFLVPGLIGFILMLTGVLSTALAVVREKERGTIEQLRVTSLHPGELIAGKTLPYLVMSLIATFIILVTARLLFGLSVRGPYLDLFLATLVYLVGALAFGLFVSTKAESQAMAFQMGLFASMLPAMFLSGFIFPIRSMPVAVQALTYLVPARYFNVILRGVILKGAGLVDYLRDMAFLLLYASVMLGISYARLTRKEA
jgi:ABC-2 type transport system permease protein